MNDKQQQAKLFGFFNEIGIIHQLGSAIFNRKLPDGLHLSHFIVLNHLTRLGDGVAPKKIAAAVQVSKATMTHTLGVLERRNFVKVRDNPDDGRSKLVYLTPQGTKFRDDAIASLSLAFEQLGNALNVEEMLEITPALSRVRAVLDRNREL